LSGEKEFWRFIGILIYAGAIKKKGHQLWQTEKNYRTFSDRIDLGPKGKSIMAQYRFQDLRKAFSHAFDNGKNPEEDPYHMVRLLFEGYNENRKRNINSSVENVFDESMSPFKPRTTKEGGLPNISFIQRKPEPIGVEYKVSRNLSMEQPNHHSHSEVSLRMRRVQKLVCCSTLKSKKARS